VQSIYEIRRIRLRELIAEVWGNTAGLTKAMKWETPSFASRLVSDSPGNQKNIGNQLARDIEKAAGKPKFTLDTPLVDQDSGSITRAPVQDVEASYTALAGSSQRVPVVGHVIATPGNGLEAIYRP
jgi:hypothetical protein